MGVPQLIMAGGGLNAVGAIQQGNAAAAAAGYNAKIAANNAQLATQNAQWELAIGEAKVGEAGIQAEQTAGKIKAAQAANGVDVNTGSAKTVQESEAKMNMLNIANIRADASRKAYGFETEAASETAQSQLDRMEQSSDRTGGFLRGLGDIIGAGASAQEYSTPKTDSTPSALATPVPNPTDNWNEHQSQRGFGSEGYYDMAANAQNPYDLSFTAPQ